MIVVLLGTVLPMLLLTAFAEPLAAWLQRVTRRLWALSDRMAQYIEAHGEHTMSWPQKLRWTLAEWRKTGDGWRGE